MRPVGKTAGSVIEAFAYDIRSWQTGLTARRGTDVIYSETLGYMDTTSVNLPARWTGFISGSVTQHYGASERSDSYVYDAVGRLTSSDREKGIRYDANGNVTAKSHH